jgi:hypothetical protein
MQCPVCEAENPDDVPECAGCGTALAVARGANVTVAPLEGLEMTQIASPDLAVQVDVLADLEPGRETDFGERTAAPPETATCPWCGTVSLALVCDSCGQRKWRYAAPAASEERKAVTAETVTCPSCLARVPREVRCSDCGAPFPLQEL